MRRLSAFALFLTISLLASPAFAQTESTGQRGGRHHKGHLLRRADVNGDGQISRDEWKRNPRAFDRLDSNRDGVISRDEAQQAARNRAERRHKALERIDKNNDGQISRDEWPRAPETFDRLDQNHDGLLTREELAAARHHKRQQ
jgi:Ca2+-binding EF-hand superfamily protein